jgi:hypothetical protein
VTTLPPVSSTTTTGSVVKGEPAAAATGSTPGDGANTNWLAGPGPVGEKVLLTGDVIVVPLVVVAVMV